MHHKTLPFVRAATPAENSAAAAPSTVPPPPPATRDNAERLIDRNPLDEPGKVIERRTDGPIDCKPEGFLTNPATAHHPPPSFDKRIESSINSVVYEFPRTGLIRHNYPTPFDMTEVFVDPRSHAGVFQRNGGTGVLSPTKAFSTHGVSIESCKTSANLVPTMMCTEA